MDVDVDQRGIDADVDGGDGVPAPFQASLVTLLERIGERPRGDGPAVHSQHDSVATPATEPGLGDHAADERHAHDLQHLLAHGGAVHRCKSPAPVAVACAADRGASVDRELKPDVGMEERERDHDVFDGRDLGGIGFEELQPRGYVGKEVAHVNCEPRQERAGAMLDHLAGPNVDSSTRAGAFDIADGGNARKSLAAKAQGGDAVEVCEGGHLAGRVTHKSEAKLIGGYAAAIVADAD